VRRCRSAQEQTQSDQRNPDDNGDRGRNRERAPRVSSPAPVQVPQPHLERRGLGWIGCERRHIYARAPDAHPGTFNDAFEKASRSPGCRDVTRLPSTTTA
jgi:hypothetical protein